MDYSRCGYRPASFYISAEEKQLANSDPSATAAQTGRSVRRQACALCRRCVAKNVSSDSRPSRQSGQRYRVERATVKESHSLGVDWSRTPDCNHCHGHCQTTIVFKPPDHVPSPDSSTKIQSLPSQQIRLDVQGQRPSAELLNQQPHNTLWLTQCSRNCVHMSPQPPVPYLLDGSSVFEQTKDGIAGTSSRWVSHSRGNQHLPEDVFISNRCSCHFCLATGNHQQKYIDTEHHCAPIGAQLSDVPMVRYNPSLHSSFDDNSCEYVSPPTCLQITLPHVLPISQAKHLTKNFESSPVDHQRNGCNMETTVDQHSVDLRCDRGNPTDLRCVSGNGVKNGTSLHSDCQSLSISEYFQSCGSKYSDDSFSFSQRDTSSSPIMPPKCSTLYKGESHKTLLTASDLSVAQYKRHLYRSTSAPQRGTISTGSQYDTISPLLTARPCQSLAPSHCNSQDSAFVSESCLGEIAGSKCNVAHEEFINTSVLHTRTPLCEKEQVPLKSVENKLTSIDYRLKNIFKDSEFLKCSRNNHCATTNQAPPHKVRNCLKDSRTVCQNRFIRPQAIEDRFFNPSAKPRLSSLSTPLDCKATSEVLHHSLLELNKSIPSSQRDRSKQLSNSKNLSKQRVSALAELEVLFDQMSVELDDDELLDRAERRDLPTEHQLLWRSHSDYITPDESLDLNRRTRHQSLNSANKILRKVSSSPSDDVFTRKIKRKSDRHHIDVRNIVYQSGSYLLISPIHSLASCGRQVAHTASSDYPDITLDDVAYRKHLLANSLRIIDPQPAFGIPLSCYSPQSLSTSYLELPVPKNVERRQSSCKPRLSADVVLDDLAYRSLRRDNGDHSPCRSLSPPRAKVRPTTMKLYPWDEQTRRFARDDVLNSSRRSNGRHRVRCVCGEHDVSDTEPELSEVLKLYKSPTRSFLSHTPASKTPGTLYSLFVENNGAISSDVKCIVSSCSNKDDSDASRSKLYRSHRPFYDHFSSPVMRSSKWCSSIGFKSNLNRSQSSPCLENAADVVKSYHSGMSQAMEDDSSSCNEKENMLKIRSSLSERDLSVSDVFVPTSVVFSNQFTSDCSPCTRSKKTLSQSVEGSCSSHHMYPECTNTSINDPLTVSDTECEKSYCCYGDISGACLAPNLDGDVDGESRTELLGDNKIGATIRFGKRNIVPKTDFNPLELKSAIQKDSSNQSLPIDCSLNARESSDMELSVTENVSEDDEKVCGRAYDSVEYLLDGRNTKRVGVAPDDKFSSSRSCSTGTAQSARVKACEPFRRTRAETGHTDRESGKQQKQTGGHGGWHEMGTLFILTVYLSQLSGSGLFLLSSFWLLILVALTVLVSLVV